MLDIYLEAYTPAENWFGTWGKIYKSQKYAVLDLTRDAFSGDNLSINSKRHDLDSDLTQIRPVRLHLDGTKIFDGFSIDPAYQFRGKTSNQFSVTALSWDKELSNIFLDDSDEAVYTGVTIETVLKDIVKFANDYGMRKGATYYYDINKTPSTWRDVLTQNIASEMDFSGQSILTALGKLSEQMDVRASLLGHVGQYYIKTDALQSDSYIYLIPLMANTDIASSVTYKNFQLSTKKLKLNYSKLCNAAIVVGKNGITSYSVVSNLVPETQITTHLFDLDVTSQPQARHYLRMTFRNASGSDITGTCTINGFDEQTPYPNEIHETFFLTVPANSIHRFWTDERYKLLSTGTIKSFNFDGFNPCYITVDECSYSLCGRSMNKIGTKKKIFSKGTLDTQELVDAAATEICRTYHAPSIQADCELYPRWRNNTDFIGQTVALYDDVEAAYIDFLCYHQEYHIHGDSATQKLTAERCNYSWEFDAY